MNEKFLIFKASRGLVHMLSGLCYCIDFCIENKYILIIDTLRHVPFQLKFNEVFNIDTTLLTYYDNNYDVIPDDYMYNNLNKNIIKNTNIKQHPDRFYYLKDIKLTDPNEHIGDKIIVYTCGGGFKFVIKYFEYFKLNKDLIANINKNLITDNYISIHYRNTDKKMCFIDFVSKINKLLTEHNNVKILYIASDDTNSYEQFVKQYPTINVIRHTIPPDGISNLHYSRLVDIKTKIIDIFTDIYYCINGTYFIGSNGSGLTTFITYIRNNCKHIFV